MVRRLLVALVASSVIVGATMAQSQQTVPEGKTVAPTKDGWWIRVNQATTKATRIEWQFGTTPNNLTAKDSWQPTRLVEAYLPPYLRDEKVIHIRATATPASAPVSFCVFWQQQVVEFVEFTGTVDRQISASTGPWQCRTSPAPRLMSPPPPPRLIYRHEGLRDVLPPKSPAG
jgi:hypothetical protein